MLPVRRGDTGRAAISRAFYARRPSQLVNLWRRVGYAPPICRVTDANRAGSLYAGAVLVGR